MPKSVSIFLSCLVILIIIIIIIIIIINPCDSGSSLNGEGLETSQEVKGKLCRCIDKTYYPRYFGGCTKCKNETSTDGKGGYENLYCKCMQETHFYNSTNMKCESCIAGTLPNKKLFSYSIDSACEYKQ